jgi:uncharacterized membrane protein YeaQ/YmgE (transglycosylase-associated protein family)
MFTYYFNIGLIYFLIGFGVALFFYFVLKKEVLGRFWGALLVGLVGSFLGGVIEFFFKGILDTLSNLFNAVNIFPPIITAFVLIWLFSRLSQR